MSKASHHQPSRRTVLAGAAGVAGAAALGAAAPLVLERASAQAPALAVRRDIASFPQNDPQLAKFEAAIKEMQDRSANDKELAVNISPNVWLSIPLCYWFTRSREVAGNQTM